MGRRSGPGSGAWQGRAWLSPCRWAPAAVGSLGRGGALAQARSASEAGDALFAEGFHRGHSPRRPCFIARSMSHIVYLLGLDEWLHHRYRARPLNPSKTVAGCTLARPPPTPLAAPHTTFLREPGAPNHIGREPRPRPTISRCWIPRTTPYQARRALPNPTTDPHSHPSYNTPFDPSFPPFPRVPTSIRYLLRLLAMRTIGCGTAEARTNRFSGRVSRKAVI